MFFACGSCDHPTLPMKARDEHMESSASSSTGKSAALRRKRKNVRYFETIYSNQSLSSELPCSVVKDTETCEGYLSVPR